VAGRTGAGSPLRGKPERYGPWETAYTLFRRWQIDGIWARVLKRPRAKANAAGYLEWEVSVDSTVCRAHQHAAGPEKPEKKGPVIRAGRAGASRATTRSAGRAAA
jgi:transposase